MLAVFYILLFLLLITSDLGSAELDTIPELKQEYGNSIDLGKSYENNKYVSIRFIKINNLTRKVFENYPELQEINLSFGKNLGELNPDLIKGILSINYFVNVNKIII